MTIEYKDSKRIVGTNTTTGLKAYYKFEDNGTNEQTTGVGLGVPADITVSGATYVTGKVGSKAISFDGTNDYATIGSSTSQFNFMHNTTHEFTIAFWLKSSSYNTNGMIFTTMKDTGSSYYGVAIRRNNSSTMGVYFGAGTNQNRLQDTKAGFSTDANWHHIVITAKASDSTNSLEYWQDGVSLGTTSNTGKVFSDTNASFAPYISQADAGQWLNGQLDNLNIWDRRLSDAEIATLYNSGTGIVITSANMDLGGRPTDVPDNSILIEKDTAKRYWLTPALATTFSNNFSSTTNFLEQGGGSINFVDTANNELDYDFKRDGSNDSITLDLGSALSDDDWVARWQDDTDTYTTNSQALFAFIGLYSESSASDGDNSQDGIYCMTETSNSGNNGWKLTEADGSILDQTGTGSSLPHATGTRYFELSRVGNTSSRLRISSDSEFSVSAILADVTNSVPAGLTGLQYWGIKNRSISGDVGVKTGSIKNLQIYNGVSSVTPATWTRDKYTAWYEQAIRDNSVALNGVSGRPYIFGHQNTGSSKDTKSVTFLLTKYGTGGNGTLTARIYNSSGVLQHTSTNSILVSSLPTNPTFESVTFNFTGATTENTWVVCLHSTGTTSGDNFVAAGVDIVTGVTHKVMTGSTSFTTYTDRLITITIKGDN